MEKEDNGGSENERSNERKKDNDKNVPSLPSSLPHSLAPAAMDGWHGGTDMPRFAMPAPFEEIGLTDERLCLRRRHGRNKQCQGQLGRSSVGMAGGLTGRGEDALPRMADA